jgi:hypothetical protein
MAEKTNETPNTAGVRLRAPEPRDRPSLLRWRGDTHTQVDLMLRVTHTDAAEDGDRPRSLRAQQQALRRRVLREAAPHPRMTP